MRSYRQFCALARALDVIGDRWTLLIVRELLLRPCRYTDLRDGLPGIATNLLAERLRELEAANVVEREDPEPPVHHAVPADRARRAATSGHPAAPPKGGAVDGPARGRRRVPDSMARPSRGDTAETAGWRGARRRRRPARHR